MRSRIFSNGRKWFVRQRAQCLVSSSQAFSTRVRTYNLQPAFTAERERRLYSESNALNLPFFSRAFWSKTLADKGSVSDEDELSKTWPAPESGKSISKKDFVRLGFMADVVGVLQKWTNEGNDLAVEDIKNVVRNLRRLKRYEIALQVSEWMQKHKMFKFDTDYCAVHMRLIAQVHGMAQAEEYFADLPENAKNKKTHVALLQCYVQKRLIEKAEQQMEKIKELGFARDGQAYCEMMTLYMAVGQTDKVLLEVKHMKEMKVPLDPQTYNLWISACGAMSDIDGVEKIVDEIKGGSRNNVNWTTYRTLANVYINAGRVDKAESALKELKKRMSQRCVDGCDSLITLYGVLGKKEEVYRIWHSVKAVFDKPFFSTYKSVLTSLVKVGDIEGAEQIFHGWESLAPTINWKLSNILLEAYVMNGMLEKAEIFHANVSGKKCYLNGRTWEILTEGYLESKQISKAIVSMKEALIKGKPEKWQPKSENVRGILKYFEEQGNVEDAEEFKVLLRRFK
ncbi:large ribosomal subunit protein mL101 (rPPR4) [Cryptomeria japonica]|uniref:large ribosomal subunit protein mL101 (rPPR4) n=1 Tax=Cryptomeria japonica TaxID=3369 RepID=UPI0025ACFF9A|nr:large ribosomal subunit protein mL101 (rPPR4) [Cryptomeria japonica]